MKKIGAIVDLGVAGSSPVVPASYLSSTLSIEGAAFPPFVYGIP